MAKRPRDQHADPGHDAGGAWKDELSSKKRKAGENITNGELKPRLSKEERREKKRQRRVEKGQENVENLEGIRQANATLDGCNTMELVDPGQVEKGSATIHTNGDDSGTVDDETNRAQAKAAKKEARRQENLKTSRERHKRKAFSKQNGELDHAAESMAIIDTGSASYQEEPALTALSQDEVDSFLKDNHISIKDPTSTSTSRPIFHFAYLPRTADPSPSVFSTFKSPTPVQAAAWPFLLSGRDMIGVAETGSGKTLAFGIPLVNHLRSSPLIHKGTKAIVHAIVVSPTRELASQIYDQICLLATPIGLSCACLYGGVPKDDQRTALKKAQIIIATPGRLNDLIEEGAADLSRVRYLVLDEADRMLDKGFEDAIRQIISNTPPPSKGRQTLMFTATWPPSVRELASTFMNEPVHISIGRDNPTGELRANVRIEQRVRVVDPREKETRLLQILKDHQKWKSKGQLARILIFALYKKEASRLHSLLLRHSLPAVSIHGDMPQQARTASLSAFKSGEKPLLVATDVAARGLDIPDVALVINVTFPLTAEDYVHRIGRTGRAGKDGLAITLFTEHDKGNSGALINVLKAAGQPVPEALMKFGGTVKKKGHEAYGNFYKDLGDGEKAVGKKIKFE